MIYNIDMYPLLSLWLLKPLLGAQRVFNAHGVNHFTNLWRQNIFDYPDSPIMRDNKFSDSV